MNSRGPPIDGARRTDLQMPLTVFDSTEIPTSRRARIEGAVVAGGRSLSQPYEAWTAADPLRGIVRVMITGPQGFRPHRDVRPHRRPGGDHAAYPGNDRGLTARALSG